MFVMLMVSYLAGCLVTCFHSVALVFVMMIVWFLLFFHQGKEAMYSTQHDSGYMVSRVMGEVFQDQIVSPDGMELHLFEYLLVEC